MLIIRTYINPFEIGIKFCSMPFNKSFKLFFMVTELLSAVFALNGFVRFIREAFRMLMRSYFPHDKQSKRYRNETDCERHKYAEYHRN